MSITNNGEDGGKYEMPNNDEINLALAVELSLLNDGNSASTGSSSGREWCDSRWSALPGIRDMLVSIEYEGIEDDELTILPGEIVTILDDSDAATWVAKNGRGVGKIPSNFVTMVEQDDGSHQQSWDPVSCGASAVGVVSGISRAVFTCGEHVLTAVHHLASGLYQWVWRVGATVTTWTWHQAARTLTCTWSTAHDLYTYTVHHNPDSGAEPTSMYTKLTRALHDIFTTAASKAQVVGDCIPLLTNMLDHLQIVISSLAIVVPGLHVASSYIGAVNRAMRFTEQFISSIKPIVDDQKLQAGGRQMGVERDADTASSGSVGSPGASDTDDMPLLSTALSSVSLTSSRIANSESMNSSGVSDDMSSTSSGFVDNMSVNCSGTSDMSVNSSGASDMSVNSSGIVDMSNGAADRINVSVQDTAPTDAGDVKLVITDIDTGRVKYSIICHNPNP